MIDGFQRAAAAMKIAAAAAVAERENTILTTALMLGCDLEVTGEGYSKRYRFQHPETGYVSNNYGNKITACDMFLSHIGVYVDPRGEIHLPPELKYGR